MTTTIEIQNLKCGGCSNMISKKLNNLPFIKNLEINVEGATVRFDILTPGNLVLVQRKLPEMGYPVIEDSNTFGKKAK